MFVSSIIISLNIIVWWINLNIITRSITLNIASLLEEHAKYKYSRNKGIVSMSLDIYVVYLFHCMDILTYLPE